jgi:predicted porin
MRNRVKQLVLFAAAVAVMAPATVRAVEIKAGAWDLSISGNVNAFATYTVCGQSNATIGGVPLACSKDQGTPNQFSIESGLLPSALVLGAKTRAYDAIDTSATLGLYPGLHVSDTRTGAGSNDNFSIDVRQLFLTIGDARWGTVKLGKDLGLFGSDVILSDMLLLGVGAGTHNALNHNVTLGHIGSGYIYADWIPQVAYTTPTFGGLAVTVALVEAFGANNNNGVTGFIADAANVSNPTPGFQGRVSYDFTGPASGRAWIGGMYQNAKLNAPPSNPSLTSVAGEAGVKVNFSGVGALAYGYVGDGIGTTLIGLDATPGTVTNGSVDTRQSHGFFGQLTYQIPDTKLKPGISYGKSYLDLVKGEVNPDFLRSNEVGTAALFYAVTTSVTVTLEYDHVRSTSQSGGLAKSNSGALGAIIFF